MSEAAEKITVGYIRAKLTPELKNYMDLTEAFCIPRYLMKIEEWERSHPEAKNILRQEEQQTSHKTTTGGNYQSGTKKNLTCFYYGKFGHMSRDCRARLAGDNTYKQTPVAGTQSKSIIVPTGAPLTEKKPIVCLACHQVGHKSPQCPKRQQGSVKIIQIPVDYVKALRENEIMAQISGILVPVTIDSGAQITVVPEELVKQTEFTGETTTFKDIMEGQHTGRLANIVLQIGGQEYPRKAVAVPGSDISWTVAMSIPLKNKEEINRLLYQLDLASELPEEETHFLPPCMEET